MRFLPHLPCFDRQKLDELHALDCAYLAVLPPVVVLLKLPMLIFVLVVAGLLARRKKPTTVLLAFVALLGIAAIFFSLYGAFNFAGLSRLKLFVELITYLLLLAVALQRLAGTVNIYLRISPVLLLALSLFFFDSAAMLAYVVVEIFLLLWIVLAYRMQSGPVPSFRAAARLFAFSLPWVALLFIFFPRISFEHASYGFRADELRRMGHDGLMHLDAAALSVPSERIVMEVGFYNGRIPASNRLYFRGSVLYVHKKDHWEPLPASVRRRYPPERKVPDRRFDQLGDIVAYTVSLYPTYKKWLYMLDIPIEAPTGAKIDADFATTLDTIIEEPQHYEGGSALRYRYGADTEKAVLDYALAYDRSSDPKTLHAARAIAERYPDSAARAQAVYQFMHDANLTYTLRPEPLDLNHSVDAFLFGTNQGYCVHFANAYALMCRMAGVPARILTGYKADRANSVKNYLAVREKDAHAWCEVYVHGHWERVDPTASATYIDRQSMRMLRYGGPSDRLTRLNLYLLYVKYKVDTWVLNYSHFRQMRLIESLRTDPSFALKFVLGTIAVFAASLAFALYLRRPGCGDRISCRLAAVLRRLKKEGCTRNEGETLHRFFARCAKRRSDGETLETIDRHYHRLRYKEDTTAYEAFNEAVKTFLKKRRYTSKKGSNDAI